MSIKVIYKEVIGFKEPKDFEWPDEITPEEQEIQNLAADLMDEHFISFINSQNGVYKKEYKNKCKVSSINDLMRGDLHKYFIVKVSEQVRSQ